LDRSAAVLPTSLFHVPAHPPPPAGTTGAKIFTYAAADQRDATFQVAQARHAAAAGVGAVDTIAVQAFFTGDAGGCRLFAFATTGPKAASGVPAWTATIPNCYADTTIGDLYRIVDFSDDGSLVVASLYVNDTADPTKNLAKAFAYDGQTGALKWTYSPSGPAGGAGVQVTKDGAWVAYTNSPFSYVLDGATGALRGKPVPSEFAAYVSTSGAYVAAVGAASAFLYAWAGDAYAVAQSIPPPSGCADGCTYPWDVAMSSDDAALEYASFGWIDGTATQTAVTAYAMRTGAVELVANWTSAKNAKLQTNPTIRCDGEFIAVATWGDSGGDVPTVVLLQAATAAIVGPTTPLFTYATPGSMFGVDVVVAARNASATTLMLAAAGKAVPANVMGNGGDAFGWLVSVPA
jgi:hypothetical protein